jgi:acyl-coenzyme A thioesterase PaaI-like protein
MRATEGRPRVLSERQCKWLLNLFPPLLFNRIRVAELSRGFRYCRVEVGSSRLTRNLQGSTFGGTIFSAADPFHAVMYWQILAHRGERVQAWLRSASIAYLKPASSRLTLEFVLTDEDVERACAALESAGRYAHRHRAEAVDRSGQVCAVIEAEVYLRKPRVGQKEVSAF